MTPRIQQAQREELRRTEHQRSERGSALVIALLIMVIMTLLGLAFVLVGDTEARIARNQRDVAQAQFVAEGGVRMVRAWFEDPTGTGYLVPTTGQMDRTQRWVDDDNDGTYIAYTSAPSPYNVVYRNSTNDPFERPYRGSPAMTLLGTEDHPDVRISLSGSVAEKNYLNSLNSSLFGAFPTPLQQSKVTEILVYGPPMLPISGVRTRYGIATVKVTAKVFEQVGGPAERAIASRTVTAVLNQAPYPASGPIQSCAQLDAHGNFAAHWGLVTSVGTMNLNSNLDNKIDSGIPWYNASRIIARDMNLDGTLSTSLVTATPDDQDHDGTLDWDDWVSGPNVEDPWLRFWSEGPILSNSSALTPGCVTSDCQPMPFFQPPSTFGTGSTDHSNMIMNISLSLCPTYEYAIFKALSQDGNHNCYYYSSDGPGTSTFKLNGSGASIDAIAATNNKTGLFFFDTTTNSAPVDADANGTYDNLTGDVSISGGGYTTGGLIYLNANFATSGSGSVSAQRQLVAPAEPYIDANANGVYDNDEYFVDLNYPATRTGTYSVNGLGRVIDGDTRQDPAVDAGTAGKWNTDINMYGIMYINGKYDAQGNWIYFGSIVTKNGTYGNGGSGTPDIYFDERIVKGTWPPPELGLPRTIITAWSTQ